MPLTIAIAGDVQQGSHSAAALLVLPPQLLRLISLSQHPSLPISSTLLPSTLPMSAPAAAAPVGEWKVQVYLYDLSQGTLL